ncbi:hypothetical protein EMIT0196MI5_230039 [Pseudomonas sp. IT-196MI5]
MVTGSKYLLDHRNQHVLTDCGLFQGYNQLRLHNRDPFQLPVSDLDAIVLTHAHLDHSGYLPVLVRNGYRGPVYATPATCELVKILLLDSGRLQEEEADLPVTTAADCCEMRRTTRTCINPRLFISDVPARGLRAHRHCPASPQT